MLNRNCLFVGKIRWVSRRKGVRSQRMTKFDKAAKTIVMKTVETAEVKYIFELLKTRVHSWAKTLVQTRKDQRGRVIRSPVVSLLCLWHVPRRLGLRTSFHELKSLPKLSFSYFLCVVDFLYFKDLPMTYNPKFAITSLPYKVCGAISHQPILSAYTPIYTKPLVFSLQNTPIRFRVTFCKL